MKITPDFEGREDRTIRVEEEVDDDGYFYEVYVLVDGNPSRITITDDGVSVEMKGSGTVTHTNIVPNVCFPESRSLVWKQMRQIIKILEQTGIEGKTYSKEEIEEDYQQWLRITPLDQRETDA